MITGSPEASATFEKCGLPELDSTATLRKYMYIFVVGLQRSHFVPTTWNSTPSTSNFQENSGLLLNPITN